MLLIRLRRLILLQKVDYNQMLQTFHVLLQVTDQRMDESLIDLDLKASPPKESYNFVKYYFPKIGLREMGQ